MDLSAGRAGAGGALGLNHRHRALNAFAQGFHLDLAPRTMASGASIWTRTASGTGTASAPRIVHLPQQTVTVSNPATKTSGKEATQGACKNAGGKETNSRVAGGGRTVMGKANAAIAHIPAAQASDGSTGARITSMGAAKEQRTNNGTTSANNSTSTTSTIAGGGSRRDKDKQAGQGQTVYNQRSQSVKNQRLLKMPPGQTSGLFPHGNVSVKQGGGNGIGFSGAMGGNGIGFSGTKHLAETAMSCSNPAVQQGNVAARCQQGAVQQGNQRVQAPTEGVSTSSNATSGIPEELRKAAIAKSVAKAAAGGENSKNAGFRGKNRGGNAGLPIAQSTLSPRQVVGPWGQAVIAAQQGPQPPPLQPPQASILQRHQPSQRHR